MSSIDYDKFIAGLAEYADIPGIVEKAKALKDLYDADDMSDFNTELTGIVELGVFAVEKAKADFGDIMRGAEKKKALVDWLDGVIKLNFFADKILDVDGRVLGTIIDAVVAMLNKHKPEWAE